MKNFLKGKTGIVDTLVNVGIGGAANVAVDFAMAKVDALASLSSTTKNAIKIAAGALGGSLFKNKYAHAALDGVAVVGVSDLVREYIDTNPTAESTSGLPEGTIGRITLGQRNFRRASGKRVAGVAGADFMGA